MPGFPLLNLGTALAGLNQGYQQQQQQAQQRQMQQMQLQQYLQKMKEDQQQQQAQGLAFNALLSGGLGGLGGGGQPQAPMPGQPSMPMQQPQAQPFVPTPQGSGMMSGLRSGDGLTDDQIATALPIIKRDESGNRNIPQNAYSGATRAVNPSTGTHTAPSTAQGYEQFTNSTWREAAPKAGVDINQYPTAMSAPEAVQDQVARARMGVAGVRDWAPYNPKLARDLSAAGIPAGGAGAAIPPQAEQQARRTAVSAANQFPQQIYGGASIQKMAEAIEKSNPDAPPAVKFLALAQYQKLMAPDDKVQLQLMMAQNRAQISEELLQMRQGFQAGQQQEKQGFQVQQQQKRQDFTNQRDEKKKESPFTDSDVDYWSNVLKNGGSFPPGLARTAAGSEFVQKVMAKMGRGDQDPGAFIANVASVKADAGSLRNMVKMSDAATSFEKTASQNFDLALKLSKDAVPTDWGPWLNRWIENGQTQFGNENVPPYVTAMLTGANEYAKIMSGSTGAQGSTVDSRREAAELFSPYLSKGQIDRVVAVAKQDMQNRKASLYGQVDDIKGRLKSAGSGGPTADQGQPRPAQAQQAPDPTWPPAQGVPDGTPLTDPDTNQPVAIAKGGQWIRMPQQPPQ